MFFYMKVEWQHDSTEEPVLLYSEIVDGWETRKVDIYRDGHLDFASETTETGTTSLGQVPVPPIDEISEQPEFLPVEISAEDFEEIWRHATAKY
jgi:hypothetical protein